MSVMGGKRALVVVSSEDDFSRFDVFNPGYLVRVEEVSALVRRERDAPTFHPKEEIGVIGVLRLPQDPHHHRFAIICNDAHRPTASRQQEVDYFGFRHTIK